MIEIEKYNWSKDRSGFVVNLTANLDKSMEHLDIISVDFKDNTKDSFLVVYSRGNEIKAIPVVKPSEDFNKRIPTKITKLSNARA